MRSRFTHPPRHARAIGLALLLLAALPAKMSAFTLPGSEPLDGQWSLAGYAGRMTSNIWFEIATKPGQIDFVDAGIAALSTEYRVGRYFDGLDVSVAGQMGKYFGDQTNWEVSVPVIARWTRFPWSERVRTGFAFGLGLSYALSEPEFEQENFDAGTHQLLAYWLIEAEAGPAQRPWTGFARLHHRSVAFGTFGESGGNNTFALGVRYRF